MNEVAVPWKRGGSGPDPSISRQMTQQLLVRQSLVHIPPGVVHGAVGRMRVLVVGIPDISDGDLFFPEEHGPPPGNP
jgi:hypothetical protein